MFYIVSMELIPKSTHHPTNKKLRLESIKLQSGYETDLTPQTKNPTNVGLLCNTLTNYDVVIKDSAIAANKYP